MSLRCPSGEPWEKPPKSEDLMSGVKKAHVLQQYGPKVWGCRCGKIHSATIRRAAESYQNMHQAAVKEYIEDRQLGKSYYDTD